MKTVIFGNISQNLVTPLGAGSLEGRRLRVVVAEVISAVREKYFFCTFFVITSSKIKVCPVFVFL